MNINLNAVTGLPFAFPLGGLPYISTFVPTKASKLLRFQIQRS
jgi:hypothetical protein